MCIAPKVIMVDGIETEIPCNYCWQCRRARMFEFVGRIIAEGETAKAIRIVTLTYGNSDKYSEVPNEFAAASPVKRHVQLWIKRMRSRGYDCRYFIVAEYGERKGRLHFHAILFFSDKVPDIPLDQRQHGGDSFWQHGITLWQEFTVARAIYVAKYVLKSQSFGTKVLGDTVIDDAKVLNQEWYTMSKKPPLGTEWFQRLAEKYVDQGLAPQDLFYSFPGVTELASGRVRKFKLPIRSAVTELYLQYFLDTWAERRPGQEVPTSELLLAFEDRQASVPAVVYTTEYRFRSRPALPEGWDSSEMIFDEKINAWTLCRDGQRLYCWSFDASGEASWEVELVSETEAARRRAAFAASRPAVEFKDVKAVRDRRVAEKAARRGAGLL